MTDPGSAATLVRGMDVVFHAAALSSPWGAPDVFRAINVEATERLLVAAKAAGCDAFIYVSTPSIYSEARDQIGLTEASPLPRRSPNAYAATKLEGERRVLAADAPGFATLAIRPRALVGPDDRTLLPRLMRVARRGAFPVFRDGRALIDLTDVRDAADALIAADERRSAGAGRAFNVSGGAAQPVGEMLRAAFGALGIAPRMIHVPYPTAALTAAALEFACKRLPGRPEPPATVYSLSTLAFSQTFDLTGVLEALGWQPRRSPQEALARATRIAHDAL